MGQEGTSMERSVLQLTAVGLAAQLLGVIYRMALSRRVGAQTMGVYQLIMPVYSILHAAAVSGLTAAVSTLTAQSLGRGEPQRSQLVLRQGLRCLLVVWSLVTCLFLLWAEPLSVRVLGDERTRTGLLLLPGVLLLTGVENLTKHHFYGSGETGLPAAVELGEQLVRTGAVLGIVWIRSPQSAEEGAASIVLGMLISEIFSAGVLTACRCQMGKGKRQPQQGLKRGRRLYMPIASVAIPVSVTALVGNLMGSANAVLLPRKLMELGLTRASAMESYGVLMGMTLPMLSMPLAIISAICLALVPRVSRSLAAGEKQMCGVWIGKSILTAAVWVLPLTSVLILLGPEWGKALFQQPGVGEHSLILGVTLLLGSVESILSAALNGLGRQTRGAMISLLCGGGQLLATCMGRGLEGFLWGGLAVSGLGIWLRYGQIKKLLELSLNWFQCLFAPLLAAVLAVLSIRLLHGNLMDRGCGLPVSGVSCLLIGSLLYLLCLYLMDVHPIRLMTLQEPEAAPATPGTKTPKQYPQNPL